jgi:biotin carboxyl carrier protein
MINAPAPMRILRLDHVVLRVQDLARAEVFYARLLGAAVERRLDKPIVLVQLRIGEALLDLVPGQKVQAGERVAVIEAMKMENVLFAVADGVVSKVLAVKGESLSVDQAIVEFQ